MMSASTKKKVSFLSLALGSLIVTSLSTGSAEAGWSGARCSLQCTKSKVSKSDTKLNECATNCDNTKIMDILLPNSDKLNADNQKHFQAALEYQQSTIEKQLKAEIAKGKKASKSKIKDLSAQQDKIIAEINKQKDQESKPEERKTSEEETTATQKAPDRPTRGPRPPRPTGKLPSALSKEAPPRPTSGPHLAPGGENTKIEDTKTHEHPTDELNTSKPPSYDPPPFPPHLATQHPTDEKTATEGAHEHQEPAKASDKTPELEPQMKKSNTPGPSTQNPRAILKAELEAQNPGKKKFEIDAMFKNHLETQYAGKSPAEINQALKADQDARYGGKSHKEILDSLKAAGPQPSSGSPTVTPSETAGQPSPQASQKISSGAKPQGDAEYLSDILGNPQARLKTRNPEAEAKRLAAAEEKLKNNPKANPSGDMMSALKSALDKRRVGVAGNISTKDKATLDDLLDLFRNSKSRAFKELCQRLIIDV